MKSFLERLEPENTFIVFTHCDDKKEIIDDIFIKNKL
jgi:hypothetical protein